MACEIIANRRTSDRIDGLFSRYCGRDKKRNNFFLHFAQETIAYAKTCAIIVLFSWEICYGFYEHTVAASGLVARTNDSDSRWPRIFIARIVAFMRFFKSLFLFFSLARRLIKDNRRYCRLLFLRAIRSLQRSVHTSRPAFSLIFIFLVYIFFFIHGSALWRINRCRVRNIFLTVPRIGGNVVMLSNRECTESEFLVVVSRELWGERVL